jgi:hypothetical protein
LRISQDEQLWTAKLYDDWGVVCDKHKGMPPKDAYLSLASDGVCGACLPKRPGLSLLEMYHARARKWLNESIKARRGDFCLFCF